MDACSCGDARARAWRAQARRGRGRTGWQLPLSAAHAARGPAARRARPPRGPSTGPRDSLCCPPARARRAGG